MNLCLYLLRLFLKCRKEPEVIPWDPNYTEHIITENMILV